MPRFPTFDSVAGRPDVCPGTYKLFKNWGRLRLWQDGRVQLTTTGYNDASRGAPPLGCEFEIVSSNDLDRPLYTAAGELVRKAELSRAGSTMLLLDHVTGTACALAHCHHSAHTATWVHESALPVPNAPIVRLAADRAVSAEWAPYIKSIVDTATAAQRLLGRQEYYAVIPLFEAALQRMRRRAPVDEVLAAIPTHRLAAFLQYLDGAAGFEFRYRKEEHTYLNIGKRL